jgi:hypothetical protein
MPHDSFAIDELFDTLCLTHYDTTEELRQSEADFDATRICNEDSEESSDTSDDEPPLQARQEPAALIAPPAAADSLPSPNISFNNSGSVHIGQITFNTASPQARNPARPARPINRPARFTDAND